MSPRASQGTTEGSLSGMETGTLLLPNRIQSPWELQGLYDVRGTQREPASPQPQQGERLVTAGVTIQGQFGKEAVDVKPAVNV